MYEASLWPIPEAHKISDFSNVYEAILNCKGKLFPCVQKIATSPSLEELSVDFRGFIIEATEQYSLRTAGLQLLLNSLHRNLRCSLAWEPIDAGRNCWKGNRLHGVLAGEFHAAAITSRQ